MVGATWEPRPERRRPAMLYMFLLHSEPGTEWPADIIDQHLAFWREARRRRIGPRRVGLVLREVVRDLVPGRLRADEDVQLLTRPGVVVQGARGHDDAPARGVHVRHLRATRAAERLREALRLRDLVRHDQLLASQPAEVRERDEEVRRVRRSAGLPTARAVAVRDRTGDRAPDLVRDPAAEAAPACLAGDGLRAALEGNGLAHAGWKGVEARQGIRDLVPRRLRGDEDVRLRAHLGIVVQEARRDEHDLAGLSRHRGAAPTAERTGTPGRRLVAANAFGAAQPAEPARVHREGARERRAVVLAAHRAVTVPHELEGGVGLEGDVATQTGAPDSHVSSSFAAACAAAGESSTRVRPEEWIARHRASSYLLIALRGF